VAVVAEGRRESFFVAVVAAVAVVAGSMVATSRKRPEIKILPFDPG